MAKPVLAAGLIYVAFASAAGAQGIDLWNNPQAEAEYLALEISGDLRPPVPLAQQIRADLAAIRAARPDLADIRVFPSWLPGELLVGFTAAAYSQFKNGSFTGFDSLFATLGTPQIRPHDFGQWAGLQFGQMYHGVRLAELFRNINGLRYADPNLTIGDGNDIVARADRSYTLSRGWGDCPAGCIDRESWSFTVTDEGVFPGSLGSPVPGRPGDYNNDGSVDAADYVTWRNGLGSTYNETHYATWRKNFGTAPGGSQIAAGAAVPEPAAGTLFIAGVMLLLLNHQHAPANVRRHDRS
jgi:hypothetical protein